MPHQLLVQQNQLIHTGLFSRPLFELWGEGKTILKGLFDAFSPYGASLADIRVQSPVGGPADQVVTVNIGLKGIHSFKIDRVEFTFFNYTEDFFPSIAKILESSARWIRGAVPSFKFASHQFVYSSHSQLKASTAEEVLKAISRIGLKSGGVDGGTGVIFHWTVPQRNWTTQLVLDHSVVVAGGLFMMFSLTVTADVVDYVSLASDGRSYFNALLDELGLEFSQPTV